MKLAVMKITVFAVLACFNLAEALTPLDTDGAVERHGSKPQVYHAQPMEAPTETERSADRSESPECIPESDGSFGVITASGVTVQYFYEIEYDTNILHKVSDRILKLIQNKITDFLLPVLFHTSCSDSRRHLAKTLRRRLEAVGISPLPDDVIVDEASCSSEPSAGVSCSLAFGQASIFGQDGGSAEHQGDRAIESIEIIMKDGGLDDIVPGILKVSYVNGTQIKGVVSEGLQNSDASDGGSGEELPGYVIALIIVGAVGVVAVALFMLFRKRHQRAARRRANANPGALAFEELSLDGRSTFE
jgi:hypothetical protein